jgi:serine/threonine-protein kinase
MGEVYRADDLKLGQPVALKFLPAAAQRDQTRLDRFLNEVKTALKVTHPNVCRVHDIGEVDGQHYLSMEYVDGEDLASLLRRIERLPQNKAIQIARQLCAGLAAAHEQGILHRDLKPANVMIDGRGRAKITDFGLASLAVVVEGDEVRAGTPQYMSPEQHAGKEVTTRSDIYSLGLVLYELFTGKRAFEATSPAEIRKLQEESSPTTPSSYVEGLDPTVERIILRCLEKDTGDRPESALAVAAALPGGDPLAAALAAGETPTPGMVADAGGVGGFKPAIAISCAAVILLCLALGILFYSRFPEIGGLPRYVNMPKRPEVLVQDAREILESIGHDSEVVDSAHGFTFSYAYLLHIKTTDDSPDRWQRLASNQPPAVMFWYRQSPRYLAADTWYRESIQAYDPEMEFSGEALVNLDPEGRLRWLEILPPQMDDAEEPSLDPDWSQLFRAAGLDISSFDPVEPVWTPYFYADIRAAWMGSYPSDPSTTVRVEAAAYRGRPVFFRFVESYQRPWMIERFDFGFPLQAVLAVAITMLVALIVAAALIARRNLRLGRGDRRGATKLAMTLTTAVMLEWALLAHHVPDPGIEFMLFTKALGLSSLIGCLVWLAYIALEPFLRRRWPDCLVSWNRLLIGRFRDPLIGRDILAGVTAFWVCSIVAMLAQIAPRWLEYPPDTPEWASSMQTLLGGRYVAGIMMGRISFAIALTIGVLFLLLFLRVILRKQWLAFGVFLLIVAGLVAVETSPPALYVVWLVFMVYWAAIFFLLNRFGLLSVMAFFVPSLLVDCAHFSPDWYRMTAGLFISVILALAAYAFYISLAGRPIVREGVIPEVESS